MQHNFGITQKKIKNERFINNLDILLYYNSQTLRGDMNG